MKVHKIVLMVIDHDEVGKQGIVNVIEDQNYPNMCILPSVMDIETKDIGEWSDDHPLNMGNISKEFNKLFNQGEKL